MDGRVAPDCSESSPFTANRGRPGQLRRLLVEVAAGGPDLVDREERRVLLAAAILREPAPGREDAPVAFHHLATSISPKRATNSCGLSKRTDREVIGRLFSGHHRGCPHPLREPIHRPQRA